ncbi:MAG: SIR2 family protein [Myxococcales bacterium]|nr:SIR2 family protein [Myxococcales bacterium]
METTGDDLTNTQLNQKVADLMEELVEAAIDKKLVILVGAGVSYSENQPWLWKKLLDNMLLAAKSDGSPAQTVKAIKRDIHCGHLLDAASRLDRWKGRAWVVAQLSAILGDGDLEPTKFHHTLAKLATYAVYVTTNYDRLLEQALRDSGGAPEVVFLSQNAQIGGLKPGDVFKLHGDVDHPEHVVFSRADYRKVTHDPTVAWKDWLKAHATVSTVLVVGYRFGDPHIRDLFDGVQAVFGGNDRHKPVWLEKQNDDAEWYAADYGLRLVPLADYDEAPRFVERLVEAIQRRERAERSQYVVPSLQIAYQYHRQKLERADDYLNIGDFESALPIYQAVVGNIETELTTIDDIDGARSQTLAEARLRAAICSVNLGQVEEAAAILGGMNLDRLSGPKQLLWAELAVLCGDSAQAIKVADRWGDEYPEEASLVRQRESLVRGIVPETLVPHWFLRLQAARVLIEKGTFARAADVLLDLWKDLDADTASGKAEYSAVALGWHTLALLLAVSIGKADPARDAVKFDIRSQLVDRIEAFIRRSSEPSFPEHLRSEAQQIRRKYARLAGDPLGEPVPNYPELPTEHVRLKVRIPQQNWDRYDQLNAFMTQWSNDREHWVDPILKFARSWPDDVYILDAAKNVLEQARRTDKAIEYGERIFRILPSTALRWSLGRMYLLAHRYPDAWKMLAPVASRGTVEDRLNTVQAALFADLTNEAYPLAEQLHRDFPRNPGVAIFWAIAQEESKKFPQAFATVDTLLANGADKLPVAFLTNAALLLRRNPAAQSSFGSKLLHTVMQVLYERGNGGDDAALWEYWSLWLAFDKPDGLPMLTRQHIRLLADAGRILPPNVGRVLNGLVKNADGSRSHTSVHALVAAFAEAIVDMGVRIEYRDEQLRSAAICRILDATATLVVRQMPEWPSFLSWHVAMRMASAPELYDVGALQGLENWESYPPKRLWDTIRMWGDRRGPLEKSALARGSVYALASLTKIAESHPDAPSAMFFPLMVNLDRPQLEQGQIRFSRFPNHPWMILSAVWEDARRETSSDKAVEIASSTGEIVMINAEIAFNYAVERWSAANSGAGVDGMDWVVPYRFPHNSDASIPIRVPVEAVILRLPDAALEEWAPATARLYGPLDVRVAQLFRELGRDPSNMERRRKTAFQAAMAPWRFVREDPTVILSWVGMADDKAMHPFMLTDLRAMLGETDDVAVVPLWEHFTGRWSNLVAQDGGKVDMLWADQLDLLPLFEPGVVVGIAKILAAKNQSAVTVGHEIKERLRNFNDHAITRVTHDMLAVVCACRFGELAAEEAEKWRSLVQSTWEDILDTEGQSRAPVEVGQQAGDGEFPRAPHDPRSLGVTFAATEPAIIRRCALIVNELAVRSNVFWDQPTRLWVTWRFYTWYVQQWQYASPEAQIEAMKAIQRLDPGPSKGAIPDVCAPEGFGPSAIDYRLTVALYALWTAESLSKGEAKAPQVDAKEAETPTDSGASAELPTNADDLAVPRASLLTPQIRALLVKLAERPLTDHEKRLRIHDPDYSVFGWKNVGTVPDLALMLLLLYDSGSFLELNLAARHTWLRSLSGSAQDGDQAPRQVRISLPRAAVAQWDRLDDESKRILADYYRDILPEDYDWWAAALGLSLFQTGLQPDLDAPRRFILDTLGTENTDVLLAEMFQVVSEKRSELLDAEVARAMELDVAKRSPELVLEALTPAMRSTDPLARDTARAVMAKWANRSEFSTRPRIRRLLELFPQREGDHESS